MSEWDEMVCEELNEALEYSNASDAVWHTPEETRALVCKRLMELRIKESQANVVSSDV